MSKYNDYYKDKNNCGTVWKNTNKTNDKQPEFSGVAKVEGKMFRLLSGIMGKICHLSLLIKKRQRSFLKNLNQKQLKKWKMMFHFEGE